MHVLLSWQMARQCAETESACDIVNNMCEESKWNRALERGANGRHPALFCAFCHTVAGRKRFLGEVDDP
jgi:hypothetical protein